MTSGHLTLAPDQEVALGRTLADQAFSRASGAPLVPGNNVRILKDAAENYPAWLEAIAAARRTIHFESHIIHEDEAGHRFAEALATKAREGIRVRLLYDWLGTLRHASRRFWRRLRRAGVEASPLKRLGRLGRSVSPTTMKRDLAHSSAFFSCCQDRVFAGGAQPGAAGRRRAPPAAPPAPADRVLNPWRRASGWAIVTVMPPEEDRALLRQLLERATEPAGV